MDTKMAKIPYEHVPGEGSPLQKLVRHRFQKLGNLARLRQNISILRAPYYGQVLTALMEELRLYEEEYTQEYFRLSGEYPVHGGRNKKLKNKRA